MFEPLLDKSQENNGYYETGNRYINVFLNLDGDKCEIIFDKIDKIWWINNFDYDSTDDYNIVAFFNKKVTEAITQQLKELTK